MRKIGAFVMDGTVGARAIAMANPPVLVAFDPHRIPGVLGVIREYKWRYPAGKVVLRQYHDTHNLSYSRDDNPVDSATDYFLNGVVPAMEHLHGEPIDYVSGPNEFSGLPRIDQALDWHASFWAQFAQIARSAGYRPNILDIPVGNLMPDDLLALWPAFNEAKQAGGVWSYHSYTLNYSTNVHEEKWFSLRYRMLQNRLDSLSLKVPVILTEAGVDRQGNPTMDGWQGQGSPKKFQNWLRWFDAEIMHDPSVLGACLFQIGDMGWSSFNIEPIAQWLADQLQAPEPAPPEVIASPPRGPL